MAYSGPAFELSQDEAIDLQKLPLAPNDQPHPVLEQYELNAQKIKFDMQLNKALQVPQIALGYFNQTLVGTQNISGQDVYFGPNQRFQGAIVQTQIPIDFKAFQKRKEALDIELKQNELQQKQRSQQLSSEQKQLYGQLLALCAAYQDFTSSIDSELKQLQTDAVLQLESGQISLLDYMQLQDHKMALEIELLQWQHELKTIYIHYNWYSNENN
jgi:cobalt-zinc-cadmium resistance protein CzcA